jgi:hypothetical protein
VRAAPDQFGGDAVERISYRDAAKDAERLKPTTVCV